MNSDISRRFVECHDQLKLQGKVKSARQFALNLDYAPQSFSDIIKGKRDVTIELIRKAVLKFNINSHYLFTGTGTMFLQRSTAAEPIISVVVDKSGEERILHVPVSAQAGYAEQLYDHEFIGQLPSFSLPGERFKSGTFRCFDVKGDSMEPLLFSGDKVVCSFLEKNYWVNSIRDNHVYVIVSEGGVVVKRLVNNITSEKIVHCISDNSYYDAYDLHISELKEIWKVEVNISNFMDSPANVKNAFHEQIDHLQNIIEHQSVQIKNFNKSMELLLKNKRVG